AVRLEIRRRGRGDPARAGAMNLAPLEKRGRAAEDEVGRAFDEAVLEILPPAIDEYRVLPTEKTAALDGNAIAVDAERKRLAARPGRVFDREVRHREVVRIDREGRRAKRADRFVVRSRQPRVEI